MTQWYNVDSISVINTESFNQNKNGEGGGGEERKRKRKRRRRRRRRRRKGRRNKSSEDDVYLGRRPDMFPSSAKWVPSIKSRSLFLLSLFLFQPFSPPLFSVLPLLPSVHSSSSSSSFALLFARPRWQGSEATLPFITDFHPFLHPPSQILKEKTKRHIKYNHQQQQQQNIYIYKFEIKHAN